MLLIGSHVGYNSKDGLLGSAVEAASYGENTFMFYTGAPQNTVRSKIDPLKTNEAFKYMEENGIYRDKVIVHAPYIINLANTDKYPFAVSFLKEECKRVEELGIKYLVLHPGSHVGFGREVGLQNIINGLNEVLRDTNTTILLETMAGKGTELGITLDEISKLVHGVNYKNIGVCLDTCHLNDAGYDMSSFDDYLDSFDKEIGINYIKCIHVNDSKNALSSHKDRHENIGFGTIGFDSLINIIYNKKLEDIPKILETPYINKKAPYKYEIDEIKNKSFNKELKDLFN